MNFVRDRFPKLLALFTLVLLTELPVLVNNFARTMIDPDIWWHIRVGDWILHFHRVPHVGLFSQYAQGHAWVAYSWGFEVLMAGVFRVWGLASLPLALAAIRALITFALFLVMLRISNRFWLSWLLCAAAMYPITSVLMIRPVIFSVLFFAVELGLIFEARRTGSAKPLYYLPLLFLVWANVHIQFVYGLGLIGLFVICELLRHAFKSEKAAWFSSRPVEADSLRLLTILFVSIFATFIGPYWGDVYLVILRYAQSTAHYNVVTELAAPSFRQYHHFVMVFLLMAACFALGRKRADVFTGFLLIVAAICSFRANRDIWFVTLVSCAILAEAFARLAEARIPANSSFRLQYAATFVIAVLAAFGYAGKVGLTPENLTYPVSQMYPVRAANFVRANHLPGPMYNTFNWGGFLIFDLPEYPVSIDGRNDFYGTAVFARMLSTLHGVDWKSDPDLARANFVLLERSYALCNILKAEPNYRLVYEDDLADVFVKTVNSSQP